MTTKTLTLTQDITRLLRLELGDSGDVSSPEGRVRIVLSNADCEKNYGQIVQRIHRVIDECCPDRYENVFIHVQDRAGAFHNILKVWKSV